MSGRRKLSPREARALREEIRVLTRRLREGTQPVTEEIGRQAMKAHAEGTPYKDFAYRHGISPVSLSAMVVRLGREDWSRKEARQKARRLKT